MIEKKIIIQNLAVTKSITTTDSCSGKKFLKAFEEISEEDKSRLEASLTMNPLIEYELLQKFLSIQMKSYTNYSIDFKKGRFRSCQKIFLLKYLMVQNRQLLSQNLSSKFIRET